MKVLAAVFGFIMNFIYSFYKLGKTKNTVAFISRQSETPSMDFRYLINELKTDYPEYEIVVLCKMIGQGMGGKIKYVPELFRQMKAMASAK